MSRKIPGAGASTKGIGWFKMLNTTWSHKEVIRTYDSDWLHWLQTAGVKLSAPPLSLSLAWFNLPKEKSTAIPWISRSHPFKPSLKNRIEPWGESLTLERFGVAGWTIQLANGQFLLQPRGDDTSRVMGGPSRSVPKMLSRPPMKSEMLISWFQVFFGLHLDLGGEYYTWTGPNIELFSVFSSVPVQV